MNHQDNLRCGKCNLGFSKLEDVAVHFAKEHPECVEMTKPNNIDPLDEILLKAFDDFYEYMYEQNIVKAANEYSNKTIYRTAKAAIEQIRVRDRLEAVESMHDSIMRHELVLGHEEDLAFNYARIHTWIDKVIDLLNSSRKLV